MASGAHAEVSRRDFIRATTLWIAGLIGAVIGAPSIAFLMSPALGGQEDSAWIELGALDSFPPNVPTLREFTRTNVNGWERTGTSYGVFVLRQAEVEVRVFSSICTHLGCHVKWHREAQHYISPCHDGHFDVLGRNISGPPPRPLDEYQTRIEGGRLYVMLPPFRRSA